MNDQHAKDSKFLAYLTVYIVTVILGYVAAVTFIPLGQSGIKYADMAVPLLLGAGFGGLMGFWYAGSKAGTPSGQPNDPVTVTETARP